MKQVVWLADSEDSLADMPAFVKGSFGHRLWEVQIGDTPFDMKPLPQLGRGIYELRESFDTNAYRLVYVVNLKTAIYVLDVFVKKSTSGIGLPKPDIERLKSRYKQALLEDAKNVERGN